MMDPEKQPVTGHVHQEAHAQGEARIYQAGRDQHFHQGPRSVTWPVWVGVVPPEADCYQPRTVTARLSAVTSGGATAVLCQVLSGLGGVGKTQLAGAHARQLWQAGELDLLVWVPAASLGDQRCPECNRFCRRLGPGGYCPSCSDVVTVDELIKS